MDTRRQQLLHHLGLIDWQLRRPELLHGPRLLTAGAAVPRLWVQGHPPGWLGDLCQALGLSRDAWQPLTEPGLVNGTDWVLCLNRECPPLPGRQLHCPDPDQPAAKRALWLQVCRHA